MYKHFIGNWVRSMDDEGRVFLKYERNNPCGSIKDQPA